MCDRNKYVERVFMHRNEPLEARLFMFTNPGAKIYVTRVTVVLIAGVNTKLNL